MNCSGLDFSRFDVVDVALAQKAPFRVPFIISQYVYQHPQSFISHSSVLTAENVDSVDDSCTSWLFS